MTLRDLFEVYWDIIELDITARDKTGMYLHRWIFAPHIHESSSMLEERQEGRLTIVNAKINAHEDAKRGGPNMVWYVKTELLPEQILDAKIIRIMPSQKEYGDLLDVNIELDEGTVERLRKTVKGRPL